MAISDSTPSLKETLDKLTEEAFCYFDEAEKAIEEAYPAPFWEEGRYVFYEVSKDKDAYWFALSEPLQIKAKQLVTNLLTFAGRLVHVVKYSPLSSDGDLRDLTLNVKVMRSALLLRDHQEWEAEILHDQGTVLGISRAGQSDDVPLRPNKAKHNFDRGTNQLAQIIQLAEAAETLSKPHAEGTAPKPNASRYRSGTAFIIMSMDKTKPELDDIRDAIVEVFRNFDIQAVRADDIEHEGLITQRVLDEISTSEFLFADLSGERPNVYYEVGYAHALGKRVILYRNTDTGIHFDLAGHNCPFYKNIAELKSMLTKRLTHMTNKKLDSLDD